MSGYQCSSQDASPASALVAYRPSSEERTPLLGRTPKNVTIRRSTWIQILYGLVSISVLLFGIGNLWFHFTHCPMDAATRVAIRKDWDMETARHVALMEEWRLERQEHATIEEDWKRQEKMHDKEVERRVKLESDRQLKVREGWARETEQHRREREQADRREHERQEQEQERWQRKMEDHDRIVEEERKREHERQEQEQERWQREVENHDHIVEEERKREHERQEQEQERWQREVENHDHIVEEERRREEEERQKLNLFWGQVEAHTCTTYATREYTAELMNLPATWEHRVEACRAVPLEVHGVSYLPKSCEDKGPGIVLGRWDVNQHEPDCAAYWTTYKDKGCTSPGSGLRRIEQYLENIPKGCSWREFCATTPARFNELEFSGAHECYQHNSATYGLWEIGDDKCA